MRVGIVNDVAIVRKILRRVIESRPGWQVAWTANDGWSAIARCVEDRPDVVLMDLIMPGPNGVETTRRIMADTPCAILVVTVDVKVNQSLVYDALAAGAVDAVDTPTLTGKYAEASRERLIQKLQDVRGRVTDAAPRRAATAPTAARAPARGASPALCLIGASSGGPGALATALARIPPGHPAAFVVAQHIDAHFAPGLAKWLDSQIRIPVRLATPGTRPVAGEVRVSDATADLEIAHGGVFHHTRRDPDMHYCPVIDRLFESAAAHGEGPLVGVVLTGMGHDGATGLAKLRERGHETIAQDQASSAVYGMPRAAAERGAASRVLSLDAIAQRLARGAVRPQGRTG